ncbi:uncharacterized protein METZ01_LOCUS142942 [marine metagenome]|uniref:Uncharacterized protein n=1 Tax=marine metagenome TaxID=408172 RepID=A0A381ZL68_9ZZZZ
MEPYIDVTKLKRNSQLLIETVQTIYEIVVTGPKSCSISIHGGIRFIFPTKARFQGSMHIDTNSPHETDKSEEDLIPDIIKRNHSLQFFYKDKKGEHLLKTSPVLSGKIISPDGSWKYDAIEREEKKDEDSNKA